MSDLALTKVSETSSSITFSHPKVAGCEGYQYFADGVLVSRTFDPDKLTIKFSKGAQSYRVLPVDVVGRADGFVWPASPPPSSYTVVQNVDGTAGAVSGTFAWTATPSNAAGTEKVEFLIDGQAKATDISSPFTHSLDTKTLVNGAHTWAVKATASDGRVATDTEQVTVNNETTPPPPPPPPPNGDVLFNGGFDTGNFSRWPNHEMLSAAAVVDTPKGKVMRAQTSGSVSMVNIGQNFNDYQHPWEIIPSDVWHGFDLLLPSGNNSSYPGQFVRSTPGAGWDVIWELHDRTDGASGYVQGQTPGSYGSSMLSVQGTATDLRWQIRMAGNTLPNPVNTFFTLGEAVQRDRWYRHEIRVKHGQTAQTGGFSEWWVDGVKKWEAACPTAFVCADGKSGERLQYGIYRGAFSGTTSVYCSSLKVGPSRASVA